MFPTSSTRQSPLQQLFTTEILQKLTDKTHAVFIIMEWNTMQPQKKTVPHNTVDESPGTVMRTANQ